MDVYLFTKHIVSILQVKSLAYDKGREMSNKLQDTALSKSWFKNTGSTFLQLEILCSYY